MKKLINGAETVLEESLDGFAAAHADILLLGTEQIRAPAHVEAWQGRFDFGRRFGA
jgi:dihydroxyacetone kinase